MAYVTRSVECLVSIYRTITASKFTTLFKHTELAMHRLASSYQSSSRNWVVPIQFSHLLVLSIVSVCHRGLLVAQTVPVYRGVLWLFEEPLRGSSSMPVGVFMVMRADEVWHDVSQAPCQVHRRSFWASYSSSTSHI